MTSTPQTAPKTDRSNLIARFTTAVVAAPLVLLVTYLGGVLFLVTCLAFAALALLEFYALGHGRHVQGNYIIGLPIVIGMVLAFTSGRYELELAMLGLAVVGAVIIEAIRHVGDGRFALYRVGITLAGLIYAGFPAAFLADIRNLPNGMLWVYMIFSLTWGTDTLAYFGGRFWGKTPLAPRISPKKTVEGAIVGYIGGAVAAGVALLIGGQLSPVFIPLLVLGPPVAILGDLFESRMKRFFDVKDSHVAGINIIPGHGGVLDRTDALIWVVALCWGYFRLTGIA
ncbi:MAG: phosphatidate cytidylyltransferase [Anaerolineae bacterium]|nr:phosphatidate cytidylyltransferase [Anaerolineae bacterium]